MAGETLPASADVVVIGAGPGGYVAAIRASQAGLDVTLVERDAYGGTCLNVGCIPSKAIITAADTAHEVNSAERMGIHGDVDVDFGGMMAWKDQVVSQLSGGVEKLCRANGVTLVDGTATFAGDGSVRVTREGRDPGTIAFEHAIVATGSRPIALPGFEFDGDRILSSTGALELEARPDRLVVVGAGYIGMELSTAFAKLGTDVTVVEALDGALPGFERDVARVVERRAEDLGVTFAAFGSSPRRRTATDPNTRPTTPSSPSAERPSPTRSTSRRPGSKRTIGGSFRRTNAGAPRPRGSSPSATWPANRCSPTRRARKGRSRPTPSPVGRRARSGRSPRPCSPTRRSRRSG